VVEIEESLDPGETVIKSSRNKVSYGLKGEGTLYLTNTHLRFMYKEGVLNRRLVSIKIPLREVREVKGRGWPVYSVTVHADKEYTFVSVGSYSTIDTKGWVAAIKQARQMSLYQASPTRISIQTPDSGRQPVCPTCNRPLTWIEQYGRWYCHTCRQYPYHSPQPPLIPQSPPKYCSNCGAQLRLGDLFCPKCGKPAK